MSTSGVGGNQSSRKDTVPTDGLYTRVRIQNALCPSDLERVRVFLRGTVAWRT